MANIKEIKNHIGSVRNTQKITNAMYLIASTKLRRAKSELDHTRPYFDALRGEIKRIFRTVSDVDCRYFYPASGEHDLHGAYAYLVITADKGLAGAYNQNVIREAARLMEQHDDNKLFVVGEYGRQHYLSHNIPIEQSFLYPAQEPTLHRAREISGILLDGYETGAWKKIFVIYTDFRSGLQMQATATRLLPFHRSHFAAPEVPEAAVRTPFAFVPDVETVLDSVIPSYVTGFIYSALVDSFCSEQNARMRAMDAANQNAVEMMDTLSMRYQHLRQAAITQEMTEISAGARAKRAQRETTEAGQ